MIFDWDAINDALAETPWDRYPDGTEQRWLEIADEVGAMSLTPAARREITRWTALRGLGTECSTPGVWIGQTRRDS